MHRLLVSLLSAIALCANASAAEWILIDDFESDVALQNWHLSDTDNQTDPRIPQPQVTEIRVNDENGNRYLIKKPAADGIVGNRKALSFRKLPMPVEVGSVVTLYARINVEHFPNNHVFGLSNLDPQGIETFAYDALEPSIRVTDKTESNGFKNDGTLMVRQGRDYAKIVNLLHGQPAKPMQADTWYEVWTVIDNSPADRGGQTYDVYLRGGEEFPTQQLVFTAADFRMGREQALIYFMANCNTGPAKAPYGNGGLRFDDLYMASGRILSTPGE